MEPNQQLLETYLRQLRLPTFIKNYRSFALDAAQNNQDYTRYLLALAEHEVLRRQQNVLEDRLKQARFPVAMADAAGISPFVVVPSRDLDQALVHDIGQWGIDSSGMRITFLVD